MGRIGNALITSRQMPISSGQAGDPGPGEITIELTAPDETSRYTSDRLSVSFVSTIGSTAWIAWVKSEREV